MLLAYTYTLLLIDKNNEDRVVSILEELDCDILTDEIIEKQNSLIEQLREMGEHKIYSKLKEQF